MNIFKKYEKIIPYIIIGLLLLKMYGTSFFSNNVKEEVRTDSTKVVKVIPEKTGTFKAQEIKPTFVFLPSPNKADNSAETNKILDLIKSIQGNQTKFNEDQKEIKVLLEIIAKKEYKNSYSDSIVDITVNDVVENGKLKSQVVDWKVKESYIDYFEKTHTYKLKPKFIFSAGLGIDSRLDSLANPQLKAVLGLKNNKGLELQLGFSTDTRASLILKQDLFTRY